MFINILLAGDQNVWRNIQGKENSNKIRWNIAKAQFIEFPSQIESENTLRIVDPDYNIDPESVDEIVALVSSTSDIQGISLTLSGTNEATGIFEGTLFLSSKTISETNTLHVEIGYNVTATFIDRTLPKSYSFGDFLIVNASSIVE